MLVRIGFRIREKNLTIFRVDVRERVENMGKFLDRKIVWLVIATICGL